MGTSPDLGHTMAKHHFLDANIIIGSTLYWDRHYELTTKYMHLEDIGRHTSERVYDECRGVYGGFRRTIISYLAHLFRNLPSSPNPFTLDTTINAITEKYLRTLDSHRQSNLIRSFMRSNMEDIRQCMLRSEEERDQYRRKITDTIKEALYTLQFTCSEDTDALIVCYSCCPQDYTDDLAAEKNALLEVIQYEPDTNVLLDSFHIMSHRIQSPTHFITTDNNHILQNATAIEERLPGILIRDPASFLPD